MIETKGFKELNSALIKMGNITGLQETVNKGGDVVLKKAQSKATGKLKNGLELEKAHAAQKGVIYSTVKLKKGYAYGVPVELGHKLVAWGKKTNRHIRAMPFMRPAADESADEVERIIQAGIDKILKEFGG